jgi:hypothetical protein
MRSERQRFIDACLFSAFAHAPDRSSRFLVERAAEFWRDREGERVRYEEANPEEVSRPRLRKTQGAEIKRRTG